MCHLISSKSMSFETPQKLNIADKVYKNITDASVLDVIDGDNKRKQVYFLDGQHSSHVSYVHADKVTRTIEKYNKPISMYMGDKVYRNITSKQELEGKNYVTYIVESPYGTYNEIREYNSGHILDTNAIKSKALRRKLFSPIKKLAQILH